MYLYRLIHHETCRFTQDELEESLSFLNRTPQHVLHIVIGNLSNTTRDIIKLEELQEGWKRKQSTWSEWTVSLAQKGKLALLHINISCYIQEKYVEYLVEKFSCNSNFLHIGASGLFRKIWSKEESQPVYVHKEMLKSFCKPTIQNWSKKDSIQIGNFMYITKNEASHSFKSDEEMNIVIDYLKSIEKCDSCISNDVIYIKFSPNHHNVKCCEKDMNLLKLQSLRKKILQQTSELQNTISNTRSSIKLHLKNQSKSQAKYELKRMKRAQTNLDKKLAVLNNLEQIIEGIDLATDQVEVVNAYKDGLCSLKKELGTNENVEQVAEIVEDLNYYTNKVTEISDLISGESVMNGPEITSDEELNEELEMLLSNENEAHDENLLKQLQKLTVCNNDPNDVMLLEDQTIKKKLDSSVSECSP